MPLRSRADQKKLEADRLQALVIDLLREEDNKYCADCDAKQPRWASWNLGVFLCIRCAGIHRNLGVHLTKVKSVNLDSWTPEQVQSMRVMGNAKAKAVYEAELPEHFRRPQTEQALESFIRAKYEHKRYILKDWSPPRVDVNDLPPLTDRRTTRGGALSTSVSVVPAARAVTNSSSKSDNEVNRKAGGHENLPKEVELLDFSDSIPTTQPEKNVFDLSLPNECLVSDNTSPTSNLDNFEDIFGPIVSAPPAGNASVGGTSECPKSASFGILGEEGAVESTSAKDLGELNLSSETAQLPAKKTNSDILALFGTAPSAMKSPFVHHPHMPSSFEQPSVIREVDQSGNLRMTAAQSLSTPLSQQSGVQFPPPQSQFIKFYAQHVVPLSQPAYESDKHFNQQAEMIPVDNIGFLNQETAAVFAAASPFANPPVFPELADATHPHPDAESRSQATDFSSKKACPLSSFATNFNHLGHESSAAPATAWPKSFNATQLDHIFN